MGRAARLKQNPDRERYRLEQMRKGSAYAAPTDMTAAELLTAAAFHEAGHIISALALGLNVHYAVVEQTTQGIGGYTELDLGTVDEYGGREAAGHALTTPAMLRKRVVQAVAGSVAEWYVNKHRDDVVASRRGDYDKAEQLAVLAVCTPAMTPPSDLAQLVNHYIDDCEQEARDILRGALSSLHTIANCLLERVNEQVPGAVLAGIWDDLEASR